MYESESIGNHLGRTDTGVAVRKQQDEIELAVAIGRKIAARRRANGWTQSQMAEKLGVGFEAVSRMERGAILPTISKIIQVADAFECPIDELLFEASNRASDQAQVIFRMLQGLPDEERAILVETLDRLSSQFKKSLAKRPAARKH
ncbi:helix-turn-helix transcriptional regulator [Paraburkholderia nemoris]|jgi:transcriptional regulator with XRE-family HTH domain|uniref:helix-turn-helix domain-containing protein n=1 Tax=Paraburkholderia nemoris TaxID=2793076 RepID=UPI0038BB98DD